MGLRPALLCTPRLLLVMHALAPTAAAVCKLYAWSVVYIVNSLSQQNASARLYCMLCANMRCQCWQSHSR